MNEGPIFFFNLDFVPCLAFGAFCTGSDKSSDQLQRRRGDLLSFLHCSVSWTAVCQYCAECLCFSARNTCVMLFPSRCMLGWSDDTKLHVRTSMLYYSNYSENLSTEVVQTATCKALNIILGKTVDECCLIA